MKPIYFGRFFMSLFLSTVMVLTNLFSLQVWAFDISRPPKTDDYLYQSQYGIWWIGYMLYRESNKVLGSCEIVFVEGSVDQKTYKLEMMIYDHTTHKYARILLDSTKSMSNSGRIFFPSQYKMKVELPNGKFSILYRGSRVDLLEFIDQENNKLSCIRESDSARSLL